LYSHHLQDNQCRIKNHIAVKQITAFAIILKLMLQFLFDDTNFLRKRSPKLIFQFENLKITERIHSELVYII